VRGVPWVGAFAFYDRASTVIAASLTAAAALCVASAWLLVRRGRFSIWGAMGSVTGALGVVALLVGRVRGATELSILAAALVGLLAGALLYGATAAFMFAAVRWPPLRRQAEGIYELRGQRSLAAALAVAGLVVAPGEEIVWRGVVQPLFAGWVGAVAGAALAWGLYVGVNLVARSIPILLGAVVGGAVWAALAVWTGGVVAAIGCHMVWTSLMIALPPVPRSSRMKDRMAEGGS
jgi:membrane protease YdiL (CAAX protease family)